MAVSVAAVSVVVSVPVVVSSVVVSSSEESEASVVPTAPDQQDSEAAHGLLPCAA